MGAVPGVIGCLQALETVKILSGQTPAYSGSLLLFDGLQGRVRVVKLRGRKEEADKEVTGLIDYEQFCGAGPTDKDVGLSLLPPSERVTVEHLAAVRKENLQHLVVDVRPEVEMEMCSLTGSINLPLTQLQGGIEETELRKKLQHDGHHVPLYLICRRGNDSQMAVNHVRRLLPEIKVWDVVGGLQAWAKHIDPQFPIY